MPSLKKEDHSSEKKPRIEFILQMMYAVYSFTYRSYSSCSVLALSKIGDSSVVAIAGLLISFLIFISATSLGSIIDRTDRMMAMIAIITVQIVSVTIEYSLTGSLLITGAIVDTSSMFLYILPSISAISGKLLQIKFLKFEISHIKCFLRFLIHQALMLSLCAMNLEKDWVVVISNKDSKQLAYTNSHFYQIDLLCNSLVPATIGGGKYAIIVSIT
jgi:hypothetical protein